MKGVTRLIIEVLVRRYPWLSWRSQVPWSFRHGRLYILIGLKEILLLALLVFIDVSQQLLFLRPVLLMFPLLHLLRQTKIWLYYVRRFGVPSFTALWAMWKLDAKRAYHGGRIGTAKRGHPLEYSAVALLIAGLCCLPWVYTGYALFLYLAILWVMLAMKRLVRSARPPAVLFLAASSPQATELRLEIARSVYPYEVACCMLHSLEFPTDLVYFHSYRTANIAEWKNMIAELVPLSQMVVMDTRDSSYPFEFEIDLVLRMVDTDGVFFVGARAHDNRIPSPRCFTERELTKTLRAILRLNSPDNVILGTDLFEELADRDWGEHRRVEESPPVDVLNPPSTTKTQPAERVVYADKNGYFSIVPPERWERNEYTNDPRSKVHFECPSVRGVIIRLIVEVAPQGLNSDHIVDAARDRAEVARARIPGLTVREVTEIMFAGCTAAHVRVSYPDLFEEELIILVARGILFNIAYSAPNKRLFERYRKLVQQSLDTLTVAGDVPSTARDKQRQEHYVARRLRLAQICASTWDFDGAREWLQDGLEQCPDNADLLEALKAVSEKKPIPVDLGPASQTRPRSGS